MNWGHKIAIFFSAFIAFMLFMLYQCIQQDFDLVTEDYYAQEVSFQEQIDRQNNVANLAQKPSWEIQSNHFLLSFPNALEQGKIIFFRPSDDALDFEVALQLNEQRQQKVALDKFKKGIYNIQLSWSDKKDDYYIEEQILIP